MTADDHISLNLSTHGESHCVILCPPGGSPARDVVDMLHDHRIEPVVVHDPLLAMAQIALFDHLRSKRTGWGLQPDGPIVLLVERAEQCAELEELTRAITEHFNSVTVSVNGAAMAIPTPTTATSMPASETGLAERFNTHPLRSVPELRLVDDGESNPAMPIPPLRGPEPDSDSVEDDGTPLVTRDELAMLLDDTIEPGHEAPPSDEDPGA